MRKLLAITFIFSIAFGQCLAQEPQSLSLYKDQPTENLFKSLKKMTNSGYTMFGMANALTVGYNNPSNNDIANSDIKDVVGDNPGFVESDFMWYRNPQFMEWDMEAMRQAHKRGAVLGYCWHLAGPTSNSFYVNGATKSTDEDLAIRILSSKDRKTNKDLDWYLTLLDTLAIPVFKDLGFPLVFRPFHEMTGNWFWWGSKIGSNNYIALYRLTIDYIKAAGVRNLLYCWSPDKSTDFSFYPGDEYVDVIGYDAYEPGLSPYLSADKFVEDLSTLVDYADVHSKVVALTEVGLRTVNKSADAAYPTQHPDFWTKYVWNAVKSNSKAGRLAWVMTWYNADWSKTGQGHPFVPYAGMNKEGSAKAVADFQTLYLYNNSLFERDMPDMDGSREGTAMFITPQSPVLKVGESLALIGGTISNWFNENNLEWISSEPNIVSVSDTGVLHAVSNGVAVVSVGLNGKNASIKIAVVE